MTYAEQLINLHYIWLDRQAISLHLCLPIIRSSTTAEGQRNALY